LISLTLNWHFADLDELCFLNLRGIQTLLIAPEFYRRWSVQARGRAEHWWRPRLVESRIIE
jgi:hypothetical protein